MKYVIRSRPDKLSQILLGSPSVSLKAPVCESRGTGPWCLHGVGI